MDSNFTWELVGSISIGGYSHSVSFCVSLTHVFSVPLSCWQNIERLSRENFLELVGLGLILVTIVCCFVCLWLSLESVFVVVAARMGLLTLDDLKWPTGVQFDQESSSLSR